MAIDFPDSPNPNDTFTVGDKSWLWDGTTWKIYSTTTSGIGFSDLSVTTAAAGTAALSYNNSNGVFTYTPPDLSSFITQQYTLPTASTTVLGGVKVDGSTINIDGNGVISGSSTYTLPTASTTVLGGVKIDGTTITINNGVISGASSVPTSITVADESADVECFPLFTTGAVGDFEPKTVSSLKLNSSSGQLEAGSFKKTGGTSSEFLKADGSIDSTTYQPSGSYQPAGSYLSTSGIQNLQGQLIVDEVNINDNVVQTNTSNELVVRGKGTGGTHHLKLDDHVTIVGDLTVQGTASFASGGVPIGTIVAYGGTTIPTGWLVCDGQSTSAYTALAAIVGNNVPNLQGRFIMGSGGGYSSNSTGGSKDAVVVEHKHTTSFDNKKYFPGGGSTSIGYGGAGGYPADVFSMDNEGVSGTDKNLPPYYVLVYIIKY